ncbi:hypothetical protein CEXT_170151 [Caerostris extrusa]|uniref:Uncharacterized protein n=1 Tax=Caerostris extrusa TaxID=172846 RepID=A0AAV4TE50_CAEEX|nr:hypothetical protein CEXT_170151 [Caerostris extrusa]
MNTEKKKKNHIAYAAKQKQFYFPLKENGKKTENHPRTISKPRQGAKIPFLSGNSIRMDKGGILATLKMSFHSSGCEIRENFLEFYQKLFYSFFPREKG